MIKLIKVLLICLIILTIYKMYPIWEVVENKIFNPLFPFFISFILSYFLYPLKCFFKKRFGNIISMIFIILIIILIILFISIIIIPLIYKESNFLINTLIYIVKNISVKYNINLGNISNKLVERIDFKSSYTTFINFFITICLTIYILFDMEKIRKAINNLFKNKKYYSIIVESDKKIKIYLKSTLIISLITFFEYLFFYMIIKHDNFLQLAFLASILNIIPYFGGMIFCLIALLSTHSRVMLIKTVIVIISCSILDSYIINPIVFKKSNGISPILSIIGITFFSTLFGFLGIILSIPFLIVLKEIYSYLKKEKFS